MAGDCDTIVYRIAGLDPALNRKLLGIQLRGIRHQSIGDAGPVEGDGFIAAASDRARSAKGDGRAAGIRVNAIVTSHRIEHNCPARFIEAEPGFRLVIYDGSFVASSGSPNS